VELAPASFPDWILPNHYQETDPGIIWTKDEGVIIDLVFQLDPGLFPDL
jgi:hypothetical protein